MIGLGHVNSIGNSPRNLHEVRLFREVSEVSDTEARLGAQHFDGFKKTAQEREKSHLDLISFRRVREAKDQTTTAETTEELSDCPIDKARENSLVGPNAPLSWLLLDGLEGETAGSARLFPQEIESFESPASPPVEESFLFEEEWFLSPCG